MSRKTARKRKTIQALSSPEEVFDRANRHYRRRRAEELLWRELEAQLPRGVTFASFAIEFMNEYGHWTRRSYIDELCKKYGISRPPRYSLPEAAFVTSRVDLSAGIIILRTAAGDYLARYRWTGKTVQKSFDCADCGRPLGEIEYYMVHDRVWDKAGYSPDDFACLACLQARLGRRLRREDFTDAPVNRFLDRAGWKFSSLPGTRKTTSVARGSSSGRRLSSGRPPRGRRS